MSENQLKTDFLTALKKAEPLGILASLSLVLTTLAFQQPQLFKVYTYSIISSSMFFISFVAALGATYCKNFRKLAFLSYIMNVAMYFFLAVGLMYMLFIIYEFSKSNPEIFKSIISFLMFLISLFLIYDFFKWINNRLWRKEGSNPILNILKHMAEITIGSLFLFFSGILLVGQFIGIHVSETKIIAFVYDLLILFGAVTTIALGIRTIRSELNRKTRISISKVGLVAVTVFLIGIGIYGILILFVLGL